MSSPTGRLLWPLAETACGRKLKAHRRRRRYFCLTPAWCVGNECFGSDFKPSQVVEYWKDHFISCPLLSTTWLLCEWCLIYPLSYLFSSLLRSRWKIFHSLSQLWIYQIARKPQRASPTCLPDSGNQVSWSGWSRVWPEDCVFWHLSPGCNSAAATSNWDKTISGLHCLPSGLQHNQQIPLSLQCRLTTSPHLVKPINSVTKHWNSLLVAQSVPCPELTPITSVEAHFLSLKLIRLHLKIFIPGGWITIGGWQMTKGASPGQLIQHSNRFPKPHQTSFDWGGCCYLLPRLDWNALPSNLNL